MLKIETFNNSRGGNAFFKAVTHPLAARAAASLLRRLASGKVAIYDIDGQADALAELYDLRGVDIAGCYVQDMAAIGKPLLGKPAQPVTALKDSGARIVFVVAFEAERAISHIRHLLPPGAEIVSLDALRLPEAVVPTGRRYLDPLNFATNFVFFREARGVSTRLVTTNYWSGYGAASLSFFLLLFDDSGKVIAEWTEPVPSGSAAFTIDSRAVRARFNLPEFTGQLFVHAIGAVVHDIVKYALDTDGIEDGKRIFSCTHDANSWPADFYAGLPAPDAGETVTLWVQNSQPCAIPAGAIALNLMGDDKTATLDRSVAPFATVALDVAKLLPNARWPQQIEIAAGKYMVRPRYEVTTKTHGRIAHVNVERTDLKADPKLPEIGNLFGKGFLLPAPILPSAQWRSLALPTPMGRSQEELPVALIVYDPSGKEIARHRCGRLARRDSVALEVDSILPHASLEDGGHMELVYDFADGGSGDGWLHALFRYEDRASGHKAETSFGAHIFNTVLTYKGEPQSYSGRAPGLSTRLFLRLGRAPHDTLCHLIYPTSTPWHESSATDVVLCDGNGAEIARERLTIAGSGSRFWRYHAMFDAATRKKAGESPYIIIRDLSCRLFGYHGVLGNDGAFSLDHMFGF
jgi:hypothetical protein